MWIVELSVMAVMIAFNGVFAAYEIALASVGLARLDTLAKEKVVGAKAALRMKRNMEASLAVVQLGITLVGAIAAATGGAGAEESIAPYFHEAGLSPVLAELLAIATVVLPLTVVIIIFGELVPKVMALRNKETFCLRLSGPMEWFSLAVWPAVWLFENSVTGIVKLVERMSGAAGAGRGKGDATALQELRAIAALARTSRLIGKREEAIIVSAAELSATPVASIMLPAQYMDMLCVEDSLAEALIAAHHDMHTRYPVTEQRGDPQKIIGYANFKDIVACLRLSPQEASLHAIVRPLPSFEAETSISQCLETLIRAYNHIALVRDQDETVLGMITLEDILEELVGEIEDEYDRLPGHIFPLGKNWLVGGSVTLEELNQKTGIELPRREGESAGALNQWIEARLDRPVKGGDVIADDGIRVVVRKVRRSLVMEAIVGRTAAEPTAADTVR